MVPIGFILTKSETLYLGFMGMLTIMLITKGATNFPALPWSGGLLLAGLHACLPFLWGQG